MARVEEIQVITGQLGMRAAGTAVVEYIFESKPDVDWDSPLSFDVWLDEKWQIKNVSDMHLDVSDVIGSILEILYGR